MANELVLAYPLTSQSGIYAFIYRSDFDIWYTVTPAFEAYTSGHRANYKVSMSDVGEGMYTGDMPAGISSATYIRYVVYNSADQIIGYGEFYWTGTAILDMHSVRLDSSYVVPMTGATANSYDDCMNGARGQAFGKWVLDPIGLTLKLYGPDGTTVIRTFSLDSATAPTTRT